MCNLQLFILHNLRGGWQPRSPFVATWAECLVDTWSPAWGGNGWHGASHQQCRATASLCSRTLQSGADVGMAEASLHVPADSCSPSPHPLGANPGDLALVWYNYPCTLEEVFVS